VRAAARLFERVSRRLYSRLTKTNESGRMTAAEHDANDLPLRTPSHEPLPEEWLTDVIDELRRTAFRRALERRHVASPYRAVIESAQLVRGKSP
jgi:hypothetical protein